MKLLFWFVATLLFTYAALCLLIYTQQEHLLFYPTKLSADFRYTFTAPFTEVMLPVQGAALNVVRFTRPQAKGVILYLHGNGDLIAQMEGVATFFLGLGYDVVIPDYRGYGKSTSAITNEQELHADLAAVYHYVQEQYPESHITLYGQSLGSGLAAKLAVDHQPGAANPRIAILQYPRHGRLAIPLGAPLLAQIPTAHGPVAAPSALPGLFDPRHG